MNKLNLIEKVLQSDYYQGNIEGGSLKNNSFTIWTQGNKYSDLVQGPNLSREVRKAEFTSFIKDDEAVILTFKLTENEAMHVANVLNNKRDANGYNLYRIDWTDDRDFRSESEKQFDKLCSSVESAVGGVKFYKKCNNDKLCVDDYYRANLLLEKALGLVKQANKKLL